MRVNRAIPPQTKGKINFHLQKFDRFYLSNGLNVLFFRKINLPIVNVHLAVNAGSKFDPKGKKGLAHLTTLLVDEGAGGYNSLELDSEFESLGSVFSVSTDPDNIHFHLLSLKENFERSLELLSLIYNSPAFTEENFEREKKKLIAKKSQNNDDASYLASSAFDKILYSGSGYETPISGITKDISKIINDDVKEFHSYYFLPENTQLIVVGNLELSELKEMLNKYFREKSGGLSIPKTHVNFLPKGKGIFFINKKGATQSEIRIGHIAERRNKTDYFAKLIANSILGGQFSSRLNLNLRENKGYTYGIHSAFVYRKDAGHFEIATSVNGKDTADAVLEIEKEVNGLKAEITNDEISFAKSYMIKRFPAQFETYTQIAHALYTLEKYNLSDNYYETYINKIEKCSREEITAAAKEKISPEQFQYVIVGNGDVVLHELRKKTDGKIIELDQTEID